MDVCTVSKYILEMVELKVSGRNVVHSSDFSCVTTGKLSGVAG